MIRYSPKLNPRTQYRLRRKAQIDESASLSEKFPELKALNVYVEHFDSSRAMRAGAMKYQVNLAHAKSLFYFNCVHGDCVGGDYDLSKELAKAVLGNRKMVEGQMRCAGTRHSKERKENSPCQSILRYKLTLGYWAARFASNQGERA